MRTKITMAEKIRRLIDKGYTNKAIVTKLDCKPQAVYNIRYQVNKARGLGSIGETTPKPTEGIGTPPKRKYTRKVRAGTGIKDVAPTNPAPAAWVPPAALPVPEVIPTLTVTLDSAPVQPVAITMFEPAEPTWKTRVKNLARALGWRG